MLLITSSMSKCTHIEVYLGFPLFIGFRKYYFPKWFVCLLVYTLKVMMMWKMILAGFLANIGFGPASLYLMRLNLTKGFWYSWKLAFAIVLSDIVYSLLALFASNWIQPWVVARKDVLLIGLWVFLFYLSWHLWKQDSRHTIHLKKKKAHGVWRDFFHILMIVLFHPGVLLMYLWLFASLGVIYKNISMSLLVIFCVMIGALLWYLPLLWLTFKAKRHSSEKSIHYIVQWLTLMIFLLWCYVFLDIFFLHFL